MECSPPGSCIHGISQAKILEWAAIPFSNGSSWPRDQTWVSCVAGRFITVWVNIHISFPFCISFSFWSEHWVELPVLQSQFSLVIYFINISIVYMAQFPSPNSSHPFSFSFGVHISVSLFCFANRNLEKKWYRRTYVHYISWTLLYV